MKIFTTEDGYDANIGDEIFFITNHWEIKYWELDKYFKPLKDTKYFKKKFYAEKFIQENKPSEGVLQDVISFLKAHEQWEADFISDNSQWWPNVEKDTLRGKLYDSFIELQSRRNALLSKVKEAQASVATEAK